VDFITGYYKRKFTPDEISALYDFYQTPIGKKVALKINEVGAGLLTELQGFMMTTLIPRFQERLKTDAKLRSALSP
ncbi:DUF2059 domain-containing protein, partial [Corallococcus exiguus]|nr:DUF2059 domain-containing protein [Corallococcus exiguus]